jgi:hypothetical protein
LNFIEKFFQELTQLYRKTMSYKFLLLPQMVFFWKI